MTYCELIAGKCAQEEGKKLIVSGLNGSQEIQCKEKDPSKCYWARKKV